MESVMSGAPVVAGKYELLRRLGKGGMAEVFLAKQTGLEGFEKLVVVKRILPQLAGNDDFVTMFLDEARTAADLRHPNVVSIFEVGEDSGTYFIAMEYLHGADIRKIQRQSVQLDIAIPLQHALQIIIDAANGLHYAHTKSSLSGESLRIVHRDVSPQNILVTHDGATKIVDFGIAKAATQNTETQTGVVKGKYTYMAPEQAAGEVLDARADQFALGIVAWELVTMRRLFKRESEIMTLAAIAEADVPPPREIVPQLSKGIDAILMKSLARRREDRFSSCQEFMMALEEQLAREGMVHSPARLGQFMKELFKDTLEEEANLGVGQLDGQSISHLDVDRTNPARSKGRSKSQQSISIAIDVAEDVSLPSDHTAVAPPAAKSGEAPRGSTRSGRVTSAGRSLEDSDTPSTRGADRGQPDKLLRARGSSVVEAVAREHESEGKKNRLLAAAVGIAVVLALAVGLFAVLFMGGGDAELIVKTTPAGARVFLNGELQSERTPAILRSVPAGVLHTVRVELDGHDPFTFDGKVADEGGRLVLETKLESTASAKPTVVAKDPVPVADADRPDSGASSSSGTKTAASEPVDVKPTAADADDPITDPKSDPKSADTQVDKKPEPKKPVDRPSTKPKKPEKTDKVATRPDTTPALLKVVAKPWAKVYVDGKFIDTTPFPAQKIAPGAHEVKLLNPDLKKEKIEHIQAKPGETIKINVDWSGT
jgi:serine/threonine protein kinase